MNPAPPLTCAELWQLTTAVTDGSVLAILRKAHQQGTLESVLAGCARDYADRDEQITLLRWRALHP